MEVSVLHPIQVKLLYMLYYKETSLYKIAEELNIPYPKLIYHVLQLHKKGLLIKENVNGKVVYKVNKKVVKIEKDKKGIFIWAYVPQETQ